jgi:hypothetical protein
MKAAKEQKKKKAPARAKATMFSTSDARANFARALGMAQRENTVIGFDRYGHRVAALVPMDAVLMLAGRGSEVETAARDKIERMARALANATVVEEPAPNVRAKSKKAPRKRAGARAGRKAQ